MADGECEGNNGEHGESSSRTALLSRIALVWPAAVGGRVWASARHTSSMRIVRRTPISPRITQFSGRQRAQHSLIVGRIGLGASVMGCIVMEDAGVESPIRRCAGGACLAPQRLRSRRARSLAFACVLRLLPAFYKQTPTHVWVRRAVVAVGLCDRARCGGERGDGIEQR